MNDIAIAIASSVVLMGFGLYLCADEVVALRRSRRLQRHLRAVLQNRRGSSGVMVVDSPFIVRARAVLRWTGEYEQCRRLTRAAGWFATGDPVRFAIARIAGGLSLGLAGSLLFVFHDATMGLVGLVVGASLGYLGPNILFHRLARRRRDRIFREFPVFLGIFQVLLQGGGSIEQCLRFIGQFGADPLPEIHRTIAAFVDDIDNGHDYVNALHRWEERLVIDAGRDLSTLLRQSLTQGTELSVPLSQFAGRMIENRLIEARVVAGKRTTHVTVVMMVFLLPPLMIVIGAPAFSSILEMFSQR